MTAAPTAAAQRWADNFDRLYGQDGANDSPFGGDGFNLTPNEARAIARELRRCAALEEALRVIAEDFKCHLDVLPADLERMRASACLCPKHYAADALAADAGEKR